MTLWFLDASERAKGIAREFPGALNWFATSAPQLTPGSVVLVHKSHFDLPVDEKALMHVATGVFRGCRVARDGIRLETRELVAALVDFRAKLRDVGASVRLVWFSGDGIDGTTQAELTARLRNMLRGELPENLYVERRVLRELDTPTADVLRKYIEARGQTHGDAMADAQANDADKEAAERLRAQVAAWLSLTSGSDYDVAPAFLPVTERLRASPLGFPRSAPDAKTLDALRNKWMQLGLIVSKQPHG